MKTLLRTSSVFCAVMLFSITAVAASVKTGPTIGILSALPQELAAIEQHIENKSVLSFGDAQFTKGQIGSVAVVAGLSGMGKVNAAAAAQRLVSHFQVSAIIFSGVAGGINASLEIGDVVIGTKAFQHDFGFLGDTFAVHQPGTLPEIGMGTGEEPVAYDLGDRWPAFGAKSFPKALAAFVAVQSKAFSVVTVNDKQYKPVLRSGAIATGDQFIAQEAKKNELKKMGADLVEMEGGAVAQVASKNDVPCMIFRSISDKAGSHAKLDFGAFFQVVAQNNALVVVQLLRDKQFGAYFNALGSQKSQAALSTVPTETMSELITSL